MKMNIAEVLAFEKDELDLTKIIDEACSRIPPLFDLENFVAVNPFLGWSRTPITDATTQIRDGLGAEVLPSLSYFRERWRDGSLRASDLELAAKRYGVRTEELLWTLHEPEKEDQRLETSRQLESERYRRATGIDLPKMIQRFVARTLADLFVPALNNRQIIVTPSQLFSEVRKRAEWDKTIEIAGITGWANQINDVPIEYSEALEWVHLEGASRSDFDLGYVYRVLGSQYGWASYIRGYGWKSNPNDFALLEALCVVLICFELTISKLMPEDPRKTSSTLGPQIDLVRMCFQEAVEDQLVKQQLNSFMNRAIELPMDRPDFQVMFCIDVRSEVIRRHLEATSPQVETVGFAGFFGVSVSLERNALSSDRCPILIHPQIEVSAGEAGLEMAGFPSLQTALLSPGAFNLVEAIGLGYAGKIISRAMRWWGTREKDDSDSAVSGYSDHHFGLTLAERVGLAEGILKNSGIGSRLGRMVVLCGHGSRSSNNCHAASLDCGACGGHCGALNARIAVEVLNDPEVRRELINRGYRDIAETLFVAGKHETSTDRLDLYQPSEISKDHLSMLTQLRQLIEECCLDCMEERAKEMGIVGTSRLRQTLEDRANDWSEVRPEWGLARNSSFIAARRFRTRGANLEGRAFLHDYDASLDTDDSILKLILTAPVVVANWINLQYFASTVDNERFGCGTKVLLNRVGNIGVISGNEGDLRPGLPLESVGRPDGSWFHKPVRLQVMIEAPREKIDRVLGQIPEVADLVRNGWMRLIALDPSSGSADLRRFDGAWEPINLVG